jgi:hypothetical protein
LVSSGQRDKFNTTGGWLPSLTFVFGKIAHRRHRQLGSPGLVYPIAMKRKLASSRAEARCEKRSLQYGGTLCFPAAVAEGGH